MNPGKMLTEIRRRLKKHNQQHLLAFADELDEKARQSLIDQIQSLDFDEVDTWVDRYLVNPTTVEPASTPEPAPYYPVEPADPQQQALYAQAAQMGQKLLSEGKVGAFVVAGGQGTRLGFDGPKGNFPITPVMNRTLFQVFADYIAAAQRKYSARCPWYVMTSPLNHAETVETLESNDYYGLDGDCVFIFQQGTMPNFDFQGRILLAEKGKIACSPDGHGGSLLALHKSGALKHMKDHGVKHLSYFQVDNPLLNIFDPLFIGLHALNGAEMSSRTVIKTGPFEKVGNFCLVDDKLTVIEYSDLPDELAEKRKPDGSLAFELGSIAIHMIDRNFVERLNQGGFSLEWHRAVKKIPHIDENGDLIEPEEPNGVKLESFIFDALPLARKSITLETRRSDEFGPVKNATGVDSAETSRQMITERAADWIEAAGVEVPRKADGSPDCDLEIDPDFALYKSDMPARAADIPPIKPGDKLYLA